MNKLSEIVNEPDVYERLLEGVKYISKKAHLKESVSNGGEKIWLYLFANQFLS